MAVDYEKLVKRINRLNDEMRKIKEAGYYMPTSRGLLLAKYGKIVESYGSKTGMIKTYDEAVNALKSKFKENYEPYSFNEYITDVKELLKTLKGKSSLRTYLHNIREDLIETIYNMNEFSETQRGIEAGMQTFSREDLRKISTKELYNMFKEASIKSSKSKPSNGDFYENLNEIISERVGDL